MKVPISDLDFYERKIVRLQSDIGILHEQLNGARTRLRTAEDYQIKYQLLLRQSNQQNLRLKTIQKAERQRFNQILDQQISKLDNDYDEKLQDVKLIIKKQYEEQIEELKSKVVEMNVKNKQLAGKAEQIDALLFKNKKIAKDLESLEDIIAENKEHNEKQKQIELKACKDSLTKKFTEKINKDKQFYEEKISQMKIQQENLFQRISQYQLNLNNKEQRNQDREQKKSRVIRGSTNTIFEQLQKCKKQLGDKDDQIDRILTQRIKNEKLFIEEIKDLKSYIGELEYKIFQIQQNHNVEIINLTQRMSELKQKQNENIIISLKQKEQLWKKEKVSLEFDLQEARTLLKKTKQKAQIDISRINQKYQKASEKLLELEDRLRMYEHNKEIGETQNLINSLKNFDSKEEDINNYENGITFLERQLKRAATKIQKKNYEVNQLVNQLNNVRADCQREIVELKQKYYQENKDMEDKILSLEDQIRELNEQIRRRGQISRQKQSQLVGLISQSNSECRSLRNLNNDLQRDYNRIVESKRHIEKSYRQQRERSVTSKSDIAVAKKQKWLQLQRQKNQIQIIYKQIIQQNKIKYEGELDNIRVQKDKIQQELGLTKDQLQRLKQKLNTENKAGEANKQNNISSDYHKKLAAINLEIALTQNIYKTLVEARSKTNISHIEDEIPERRSEQQSSGAFNDFKIESPKSMKQQDFDLPGDGKTPYFESNMLVSFKAPGNSGNK